MTETTKITGLNANQVDALRMGLGNSPRVHLTATTATIDLPAAEALALVVDVKRTLAAKYGAKIHPVASIHAPIRKLRALAEAAVPAPVVEASTEPVADDAKCRNTRPEPGSYHPRLVYVRGTCSACGATEVSMTKNLNLRAHRRP
jgi:hypothetical protein